MWWEEFGWLLQLMGFLLLTLIVVPFATSRARAAATKEINEKLEEHRAEMGKQLETHRSKLLVTAEHIRSDLSKHVADDAIYAQKRHEAIAEFYAEILQALHEATRRLMPLGERAQSFKEWRLEGARMAADRSRMALQRAALYLPDEVYVRAKETVNAFMEYWDTVEFPDESGPNLTTSKARRVMEDSVSALLQSCRAELQRARPRSF